MSWKDLNIKLKAELIKLGVLSGIKDINLIRLLYDDNITPTLVLDLSYNETNVKPLLGIERIKLEYGIPEEEVNNANDIIQLIEKEISLKEINNQLPVLFRQFNRGGYISNNPNLSYSDGGPIKRKRENSLDWRMAVYNAVDPRSTVKNIDDAFRLYNAAVAKEKRGEDFKDYTLNNNIGDLTSDAAWRKRLELPYDETLLPVWNGDTVSLSRPLELEIPVDTNLVKNRIDYAKDEFWNDVKSLNLRQLKEDLSYKKSQEELLDALRYTYKTGKPIGVSEYHANSIDPEKVLKDFKYGISPLNVLGRYNIRYDKDENKMYYSDEWDFNQYEWAVPGTTFRIRGAIPLDKKKNGGKVKKYSKGGYENTDEPPVSESTHVLQLPLNILELELLNYLLSNPTAEQEYFRNLAVLNMIAPQFNLGVILTKGKQDLVDKAFLGYNNFRYSHPWAEGLNYTPIIGDGMDLISLAGDINNKNYINAGLSLGMLVLPNFILKSLLKYGKLLNIPDEVWDDLYNKSIKNNNLEEVQQLRDLHFKAKAPDTKISEKSFIGSNDNYSELRTRVEDPDVGEMNGIYSTFDNKYANKYGDNIQSFYINAKNPLYTTGRWTGVIDDITANKIKNRGYDVVVNTDFDKSGRILDFLRGGKRTENITFNSNQMKLADAVTYDDNGKIIPLSKRDDFSNPDIRFFNDDFGNKIIPTPYQGYDSDLVQTITNAHKLILRDYFSPQKINLIKTTMNWGDKEIQELLLEILKSIGGTRQVQINIKGLNDGIKAIASNKSGLKQLDDGSIEGFNIITLNRDRIPNLQIAEESGMHEIGVHAKTIGMDAENFNKGGIDDVKKELFPRLAALTLKNMELANDILLLNRRGKFLSLFENSSNLERYMDSKNIPWNRYNKFNTAIKRFKYVTQPDEKTARAYTGLLYEKLHGNNVKTENIELLERYFTPESVEKFKNVVLGTIPLGLMSYKLFNQNNKEEYKNGGFLFPNLVFSHKFEK